MSRTKIYDKSLPFQTIEQTCRTTGLSQYYLRKGCRDGSIPCVRSGRVFYIDVPALVEKLRNGGVRSE
jgi:hypothetical protein